MIKNVLSGWGYVVLVFLALAAVSAAVGGYLSMLLLGDLGFIGFGFWDSVALFALIQVLFGGYLKVDKK